MMVCGTQMTTSPSLMSSRKRSCQTPRVKLLQPNHQPRRVVRSEYTSTPPPQPVIQCCPSNLCLNLSHFRPKIDKSHGKSRDRSNAPPQEVTNEYFRVKTEESKLRQELLRHQIDLTKIQRVKTKLQIDELTAARKVREAREMHEERMLQNALTSFVSGPQQVFQEVVVDHVEQDSVDQVSVAVDSQGGVMPNFGDDHDYFADVEEEEDQDQGEPESVASDKIITHPPPPPADHSAQQPRTPPVFIKKSQKVLGVPPSAPGEPNPTDWFRFIRAKTTLGIIETMIHDDREDRDDFEKLPLHPGCCDYITFVKRVDTPTFKQVIEEISEDGYNIGLKAAVDVIKKIGHGHFKKNKQTAKIRVIVDYLQNVFLNNCRARIYKLPRKPKKESDRIYQ